MYVCIYVCRCDVHTLTDAFSAVIPTHSTVGDLICLQLLLLPFEKDVLCSIIKQMVLFIVVIKKYT